MDRLSMIAAPNNMGSAGRKSEKRCMWGPYRGLAGIVRNYNGNGQEMPKQ
jgi:hypothetical protein